MLFFLIFRTEIWNFDQNIIIEHSCVCTCIYICRNLRNNCLEQIAGRLFEQQTSIHLPTVSIWTHSTLMHCLSFSSSSISVQFENWIVWLNIFVYRDVSVMSCTPIHAPWLKFLKYRMNHLVLVRSLNIFAQILC